MASYELQVRPSVGRDVSNIPKADLQRILARVSGLQDIPRPSGCIKLSGKEYYRLRQGDYRIVHEIDDDLRVVVVAKIGNRKDVYRPQ